MAVLFGNSLMLIILFVYCRGIKNWNEMEKIECKKCGLQKNQSEFKKYGSNEGYHEDCKVCEKSEFKDNKIKHKKLIKEYNRLENSGDFNGINLLLNTRADNEVKLGRPKVKQIESIKYTSNNLSAESILNMLTELVAILHSSGDVALSGFFKERGLPIILRILLKKKSIITNTGTVPFINWVWIGSNPNLKMSEMLFGLIKKHENLLIRRKLKLK